MASEQNDLHGSQDPRPDDAQPAGRDGDALGLIDVDTLQVVREALARVTALLGEAVAPLEDGDRAPDRYHVARALQRAWDAATAQARVLATSRDARLAELIDLLTVVRAAGEVVGAGGGHSTMRRVRERLSGLGAAGSLEETLDEVPSLVAGLGFDRVLLSRVESSTWVPLRVYFKGDPKWAGDVLDAMSDDPLTLDSSLLETQMVRRAVPLRVVNPTKRPKMNRLMITLSHTRGYVAAPIVDADVVIGFVHADCYYQGRVPSQDDLDALWLFCQALGPLLGRQALAERLAAVRHETGAPLAALGRARASSNAATEPHRPRGVATPAASSAAEPPGPAHALREVVTPREADVLTLLAQGASNEQIARTLGISLGTVKSHVKRILRRLDVANRSEAASLWLRSEYGQPAPGPR